MKKIFIGCFLVVLLLVGCSNEEKENKFLSDVQSLATGSYGMAIQSEQIGTRYLEVWKDTIFNKKVIIDEKVYTDFNNSLSAQRLLFASNGKLDDLETTSEELKKLYKSLKDEDIEKYSDEFKSAKDFYLKAVEFKSVSTEPNGSYTSYSENFSTARDELLSMYSSLKVELDLE